MPQQTQEAYSPTTSAPLLGHLSDMVRVDPASAMTSALTRWGLVYGTKKEKGFSGEPSPPLLFTRISLPSFAPVSPS